MIIVSQRKDFELGVWTYVEYYTFVCYKILVLWNNVCSRICAAIVLLGTFNPKVFGIVLDLRAEEGFLSSVREDKYLCRILK